jgi:hypothetical protein
MTRKCKVCREVFTPTKPMQSVCSPDCALSLATSKRAKAVKVEQVKERRADKVKRDKLKSKSDWAKEAQTAFNRFIRLRDHDQPCISCGRHHSGQYHAGHYLSVGARPELRFCETNVHKQCSVCNNHLSGNIVMYRIGIFKKLGLQAVDWLEGPHQLRHDTIDDLKTLAARYNMLARELKEKQE